jgi:anti-anti-sigma factor
VLADRVVGRLAGEGSSYDVALLAARREAPLEPLELEMPATPANLAAARAAIREWLTAARIGADGVQDVVLATGEALANAVEHGSPGDGSASLRVAMSQGPDRTVRIEIADEGRWRPPASEPGLRGQGIRIMRAVMDEVDIERGEGGTTVRMLRRPRPPRSPGRDPVSGGHATVAVTFPEADAPGAPAVVTGDVDAAGVAVVAREVRRRWAPDARVRLDMAGVGYLDSSGVRFLAELARRQADAGGSLTVRAPRGGAVARVLALTGLAEAAEITLES